MARQPRFEMRDRLGCEPIGVHRRKLPNEGYDRRIRYSTLCSTQLPGTGQPLV